MGKVHAICISKEKGTIKTEIPEVLAIRDFGLEQDAHAGKWHRQVSLLSLACIEEFRKKGVDIAFGAFGENLVVSGFDFKSFPIGTRFRCNDVILELTQIGKECHTDCEIRKKTGDCIMPREGAFCRVIQGGRIHKNDGFIVVEE